jgi:hypothetical protein
MRSAISPSAEQSVEQDESKTLQQAYFDVTHAEVVPDRSDQEGDDLPVHERQHVSQDENADGIPSPRRRRILTVSFHSTFLPTTFSLSIS